MRRYGQSAYYTPFSNRKNEEEATQSYIRLIAAKFRKGLLDVAQAVRAMREAGAFEAEISEALGV